MYKCSTLFYFTFLFCFQKKIITEKVCATKRITPSQNASTTQTVMAANVVPGSCGIPRCAYVSQLKPDLSILLTPS